VCIQFREWAKINRLAELFRFFREKVSANLSKLEIAARRLHLTPSFNRVLLTLQKKYEASLPMHTHRLKLPIHEAFLREERHDPVTGDAFREGDEVVFCASCRSAFLKSSWEYMGGAHCGQENTLAKIPYAQAIDVKKGVPFKDDEIVFSNLSSFEGKAIPPHNKKAVFWSVAAFHTFRVISIGLFLSIFSTHLENFPFSLVLLPMAWGVDRLILKGIKSYTKKFFALGKKYVHLYGEKISHQKVEYVAIQIMEKESGIAEDGESYIVFYITIVKDGKAHEFEFRRLSHKVARAKFIYMLLDLAQNTTVYFDSPYEDDKLLVKKLQREYEGDLRFFEEE